jgi:hypothetical protein
LISLVLLGIDTVIDLKGIDAGNLADFEFPDPVRLLCGSQQGGVVASLDLGDEMVEQFAAGSLCHLIGCDLTDYL